MKIRFFSAIRKGSRWSIVNKDIMRLPAEKRRSNSKIVAHTNTRCVCLALTWDLVDFIEKLVFDLVEGIVLVDRFGGVFIGDQCDGGWSHSQGTGPRWLSSDHGRCLMLEQVPLRHLGCTHGPWKTASNSVIKGNQHFVLKCANRPPATGGLVCNRKSKFVKFTCSF